MFSSLALTNLDFEVELWYESEAQAPAVQDDPRWQGVLRLLPEARHAECLSFEMAGCFDGVKRLTVWGVTPRTARLAKHLGLSHALPPVELVRKVNDKRFSHKLELELGMALPYSVLVESVEALEAAVAACPHSWVLKHPLGLSALSRLIGRRGQLPRTARGWALRKLERGWPLLFEPWVEDRRHLSLHFDIGKGEQISFVNHCQVITSPQGGYRGSEVHPSAVLDDTTLGYGLRIAAAVARRGYWGPLTVDSFSGMLGDVPVNRPLVDINARYSFGRLSLGLADWLPPDWCYFWWHPKAPEFPRSRPLQPLPEPGQADLKAGAYALPASVDPGQTSGTVVLVSPSAFKLQRLQAKFVGIARGSGVTSSTFSYLED
jgi:hypothetical protein